MELSERQVCRSHFRARSMEATRVVKKISTTIWILKITRTCKITRTRIRIRSRSLRSIFCKCTMNFSSSRVSHYQQRIHTYHRNNTNFNKTINHLQRFKQRFSSRKNSNKHKLSKGLTHRPTVHQ